MKKPLQDITIICDSCNLAFNYTELDIREEYVVLCEDRVKVIYYKCPKCNKVYLIGIHNYISEKLLKQEKNLILANQKRMARGLPASKQKLEQIKEIKESLLSYQDTLREKYKADIHLLDQLLQDK